MSLSLEFVKMQLSLEVFNPYLYSVSETYLVHVINLYQDLLKRNNYYQKKLVYGLRVF